jgi:Domain of unknown function (DUF2017)
MEIRASDEGWTFEDIDPLIGQLLRALPGCAAADDEIARRRIFSSPTAGADPAADEEWRENVEPEMRELFQSHVDVVAGDLAAMTEKEGDLTLEIPLENARAWIHTLNQARLALGAKHGVTDADTSGRRKRHTSAKAFALMQIDFYAMILSLLLGQTEF